MFAGIISHLGQVKQRTKTGLSIEVPEDLAGLLAESRSIAVNGVCLTITQVKQGMFYVDVMPETWKRTALGTLQKEDLVNLELALSASERFEGHIVQGHIDGVGILSEIKKADNSRLLRINIPTLLGRYIVEKGSIAVNGISLTVIEVTARYFTVGIIPYTWKHTMLHQAKVGEKLNIEVDIIAKYVERLLIFQKGEIYEKH